MLGTLIKHEFRYIIKTFSMIYIIFLLIALVLKILSSTIISLSPEKIDSAFDASSTDPMMSTVYNSVHNYHIHIRRSVSSNAVLRNN